MSAQATLKKITAEKRTKGKAAQSATGKKNAAAMKKKGVGIFAPKKLSEPLALICGGKSICAFLNRIVYDFYTGFQIRFWAEMPGRCKNKSYALKSYFAMKLELAKKILSREAWKCLENKG